MRKYLIRVFLVLFLFNFIGNIESKELERANQLRSTNIFGEIGLISNPTARFHPDGEFTFGVSNDDPFKRIYAKMQYFEWLELVLKYTEFENTRYEGLDQTAKDKGLDVKLRLLKERNILPELALGMRDIGGNGYFASEYIVASKLINDFDVTIGMGWGKLAGSNKIRNPMSLLSESFDYRNSGNTLGGTLSLGQLFSGKEASMFGGVEYFSPIPNLSLKIEYDTSNYSYSFNQVEMDYRETGNPFLLDSRFNFGLNYKYKVSQRDNIDFSLGFLRGNTVYGNFSVHSNLNFSGEPKYISPSEIINIPYLDPFEDLSEEWKKYLTELIIWQMGNEGLVVHNLIFDNEELLVEISQGRFIKPVQAIDLASRILANNSPKNISIITVINLEQGIETLRSTVSRNDLVQSVAIGSIDENLLKFNALDNFSEDAIIRTNDYLYPNFYWEVKPHLMGTLQHQIQFYFWQLEALFHTEYSIKKGLYFTTDIGINIDNNFENYKWHIPDGQLHHVRQDRRLYLTEGQSGIRRMALDYTVDINRNIKGKLSAGYLEWMYGGIGGEILYLPDNKQWGIGLDTYWVKQRDFDQRFGFQDYETITSLLSLYYDLPFLNLRFKSSAGKFLGKDKGVSLDISRRFETGARVGAIITLTDCDAACVGEGSFNKWIYFNLPMDLFYSNSTTKGRAGYSWTPLTKDAGTRVDLGGLYDVLIDAHDNVDNLRRKPWSMKKIISGFSTEPQKRIQS